MISTVASYRTYSADLPRATAKVAAQPSVKQATAAFEMAAAKVETVDDFMEDKAVYNYALAAFGMSDTAYAKGLIRRVLEGGTQSGSIAMRMTDDRYRELASTFTFDKDGKATFDAGGIAATGAAYARQKLEETAGATNDGTRLALYFQRKAPAINSAYGILADSKLLTVARAALGIPAAAGNMSIDAQAAMISKKLDVADLKDPAKLSDFLGRFAARYDAMRDTAAESPVVSLLATLRSTQGSGVSGILSTLSSR